VNYSENSWIYDTRYMHWPVIIFLLLSNLVLQSQGYKAGDAKVFRRGGRAVFSLEAAADRVISRWRASDAYGGCVNCCDWRRLTVCLHQWATREVVAASPEQLLEWQLYVLRSRCKLLYLPQCLSI